MVVSPHASWNISSVWDEILDPKFQFYYFSVPTIERPEKKFE